MSADAALTIVLEAGGIALSGYTVGPYQWFGVAPLRRIVADTGFGVYALGDREMIAATSISNSIRSPKTLLTESWLRIYNCAERTPELSPSTDEQ